MLFAFAKPSSVELTRYKEGRVPSHRLWGFCEMEALGVGAELCATPDGLWEKLGDQGWRVWQTIWLLHRRNAGAIVAVHEVSALLLLAFKRLGMRMPPLILINLALLHRKNCAGIRLRIWRLLLGGADAIVSLVEAQGDGIAKIFGVSPSRCHFLPMPVDSAFFKSAKPVVEREFCLAVGTNDGKDFETLLEALPLGMKLVIVTDGFNAAKIRAHRCFGAGIQVLETVPALELRELYRQARLVVIPLAETGHGSGHTVFVENLALGKILIVSASRGMRGYLRDGYNAVAVPVGDAEALRAALQSVALNPGRFAGMRERAVREALARFDVMEFARGLLAVWDLVDGRRGALLEERDDGAGWRRGAREDKKYAPIS
ncbi:MAG: glycosyltransferase [Verrucomicrobia bacterium]|nr:glycosyltransferase [Verrucomicrobiota bacterium]